MVVLAKIGRAGKCADALEGRGIGVARVTDIAAPDDKPDTVMLVVSTFKAGSGGAA